jgi:heptosyltransferase-2
VGTPVLSVLGPTKPEQWAPWGPEVHIEQRYPQWPAVDSVLERARRLLESRAA